MNTNELRDSAKQYINRIYIAHREDDISAWQHLIDVVLDFVEQSIKEHEEVDISMLLESLEKYIDEKIKELKNDITKQGGSSS